jgi:nucleoside-diphosphate-sugar epimerase
MPQPVLLISGADGFLGRHLSAAFAAAGWRVVGLIHGLRSKTIPSALSGAFEYSFPDRIDPDALKIRPDLFLHNAFHTHMVVRTQSNENVAAARFLLDRFGGPRGCRFAFISSMSAHEKAVSRYGLEKLAIEKMLDPSRDLAIRPGFILGCGGVFQRLARTLHRLPVVPLFYGRALPIHTVHVEDVCRCIRIFVENGQSGVWPVGEQFPVTIRDFYRAVLQWLGRRAMLLPLPGAPFLHAMRFAERLGITLPMTSENLLGLGGLRLYDISPTIRSVGFRPRTLPESLSTIDPCVLL